LAVVELEECFASMARPVRDGTGGVFAAINASVNSRRALDPAALEMLRMALTATAALIGRTITTNPAPGKQVGAGSTEIQSSAKA
jgi:DNA-binding IclR family transcriptional regulator